MLCFDQKLFSITVNTKKVFCSTVFCSTEQLMLIMLRNVTSRPLPEDSNRK